jgi:hypothetical protein
MDVMDVMDVMDERRSEERGARSEERCLSESSSGRIVF